MNLYLRLAWLLLHTRRRPRTLLWGTTVSSFRVLPSDLDALGHMNNAKYLMFMDLGRLDQMFRTGLWKFSTARGWYSVVATQTIRYRRSLKPWQKFELHTRVIGFDEKAMYIESRFLQRGELAAHAVAQVRFLRKRGGDVAPEEVREVMPEAPELVLPEWVDSWARAVRSAD
ncbi:thioesterase family protein [Nocardioides sp. Y6]|uniref:Thioesterase family protein n=1 Tax=Nocardioides malaquae TaxID=2773426 RepID=A0ABR9RRF4_9ACTN|nr:thioesterase family protein [Nocardioides malaquae]MBE7324141.1 thioesterase family protein [Nocardioides malaquae]